MSEGNNAKAKHQCDAEAALRRQVIELTKELSRVSKQRAKALDKIARIKSVLKKSEYTYFKEKGLDINIKLVNYGDLIGYRDDKLDTIHEILSGRAK